jgi:hypothetical protein
MLVARLAGGPREALQLGLAKTLGLDHPDEFDRRHGIPSRCSPSTIARNRRLPGEDANLCQE